MWITTTNNSDICCNKLRCNLTRFIGRTVSLSLCGRGITVPDQLVAHGVQYLGLLDEDDPLWAVMYPAVGVGWEVWGGAG